MNYFGGSSRKNMVDGVASQTGAVTTVALPLPTEAGQTLCIMRADASYSSSSISGLLQIFSGSTLIAEKYIHGSGALDFELSGGRPANNPDEQISASLASGGGGIVGTVYIQGYTV